MKRRGGAQSRHALVMRSWHRQTRHFRLMVSALAAGRLVHVDADFPQHSPYCGWHSRLAIPARGLSPSPWRAG